MVPKLGVLAIHGVAWRYISYFGGKFMVFLSTIFLARLLAKDDFGVVGYALTAIAFLDVASDLGVTEAVVYYDENKKNYSTAFWIGLFIGLMLFGLSWVSAPFLVIWFKDERILNIFRAMALTFPFSALGSTQEAILRKRLAFGTATIPVFLRAVAKGIISIVMAFLGYGAWSLVWGQLGGTLVSSLLLWALTPWKPSFEFDVTQARALMSFGVKDIGTSFLAMVLANLDYWLVGRYLGAEALGVYTLAYRLPELLILQFARIISQVIFPIYTRMRDMVGGLARGFKKTTSYVSLVTIPLGLGLALVAKPFTIVFLTDKWLDAVPVMQMIALYAMFLSLIHNTNSAYRALGKFKVITWLGLLRLALLFPALWWATTIKNSIVTVGQIHALVALIGCIVGLMVASSMLGLPIWDLVSSIRPALTAGLSMVGAVLLTLLLTSSYSAIVQLITSVSIGALVVVSVLWFMNRDLVDKLKQEFMNAVRRRPMNMAKDEV